MKKICMMLTLLLAAVLAVSGCSQPLEPKEYMIALGDYFSAYAKESMDTADYLTMTGFDVEEVRKEAEEAKAALGEIKNICPPEKYKELHEKLCNSLDDEYKWQDLIVEFCKYSTKGEENLTVTETAELVGVTARLEELSDELQFSTVLVELIKTIKADIDAAAE